MKKLFMGSVVLIAFSLSVIAFQMSCQKSAVAQSSNYVLPPATTTTLGGVIIGSGLNVSSNGTLSVSQTGGVSQLNKIAYIKGVTVASNYVGQIWLANYDGTGQMQVNVTLPSGIKISAGTADGADVRLSPDGKTIFFLAIDGSSNDYIYSCGIDGSNVTKVVDATAGGLSLGGAY